MHSFRLVIIPLNRFCLAHCCQVGDDDKQEGPVLKFAQYERPQIPVASGLGIVAGLSGMTATGPTPLAPSASSTQAPVVGTSQGNQLLNTRSVNQVWGRKMEPVATAPSATAPVPQAADGLPVSVSTAPSTFAAPSPAPAPAPVPEVPKELSEKEKMAAALFGGVSSTAGKSGTTSRRRPAAGSTPISAPAPAPAPAQAPAQFSHPASTVAAVPVNSGDMMDLLDMGFSAPAPAPAYAPSAAPAGGFAAPSPFDLLDGLSPSAPSLAAPSAPPAPPAAPSTNSISDVFGDLSIMSAPVASSSSTAGSFDALMGMGGGLNPLNITTAEFGQRWGQTPFETKQGFATRMQSLLHLRAAMPPSFHHVESIPASNEAIFAATSGVGNVVLVHAKLYVARTGCEVTVKASTKVLSTEQVGTVAAALGSFQP